MYVISIYWDNGILVALPQKVNLYSLRHNESVIHLELHSHKVFRVFCKCGPATLLFMQAALPCHEA